MTAVMLCKTTTVGFMTATSLCTLDEALAENDEELGQASKVLLPTNGRRYAMKERIDQDKHHRRGSATAPWMATPAEGRASRHLEPIPVGR